MASVSPQVDIRVCGRWALPLGLILSPLADTGSEVPKIPLGGAGIVRCRRCRAYMNPFMRWSDGGRCAALQGTSRPLTA